MKKYILFLVLLLFSLGLVFAGDPIEEIFIKIKDEKYEKPFKDLELIEKHVKGVKSLSENDLIKLKEIINSFYKEKEHSNYFGSILRITLALKKDQLHIVKPLMLQILSDPKDSGNSFVLAELDYIFDDYSGEMLLKYKHIILDNIDLVKYLLNNNKFNQKKYKTFRELFISLLDDKEKAVKEKMYDRLKNEISFIDCLGEKLFEKSSDAEKEIEIKKMKDWLTNTPDVDVAFDKFFNDLQNKIMSLTINNFDKEMEILKRNYQFLERMPMGQDLLLEPFNEKGKGYSLGMKIVTDEMQGWFKLHKGSFSHYSTGQLDLLVRAIDDKLREKTIVFGSARTLDLEYYKKKMQEIKLAFENKDKKAVELGERFSQELKMSIHYTSSEPTKEYYNAMLKEIQSLLPPVLIAKKRVIGVLFTDGLKIDAVFPDGKIKIDGNGLNIKISIQNITKEEIKIVDEFSLALNIGIVFDNNDTSERFQLGNSKTEFEIDSEELLKYITLKPDEKIILKVSDLIDKTKDFELPKGKYELVVNYINYKGQNCKIAGFESSIITVEKE